MFATQLDPSAEIDGEAGHDELGDGFHDGDDVEPSVLATASNVGFSHEKAFWRTSAGHDDWSSKGPDRDKYDRDLDRHPRSFRFG